MKEIDETIHELARRVRSSTDAGDALKNTQSALNLAHALNLLLNLKLPVQTTKPKA